MYTQNLRLLPYSGGRYYVSETARIFDKCFNEIVSFLKDGKEYVRLAWFNGEDDYEKGLIVLSAFDKIDHSDQFYSRIEVIYKDGDTTNLFPQNLTYVFSDEPIESETLGFFLIPGFKDYILNRDGRLLNRTTGKFKVWSTQKGESLGTRQEGYQYCILYRNGVSTTVYQHRLLCLVFKKFSGIFDELTVNHKDGNKKNNDLNNLEWVTHSENLTHAWKEKLRFQNRTKILVRDLLTERIRTFTSLRECGRFLGDNDAFYVSSRLRDQSGTIYPDYLLFKFDDDSPWPKVDSSKIPAIEDGFVNDFIARNVFTGAVIVFSLESSEQIFGIEARIVLDHARNNKVLPYKGYNFRYLVNGSKWPVHTKRHLQVYEDNPIYPRDAFIMTDTQTNEETFFVSLKECMEKTGIQKPHLMTLICTGRLYKKQYSFKYFKLRETLEG